MAESDRYRDLAVVTDDGPEPYSRYFKIPRSTDDLLKRSKLIEEATAAGKTLVVLVKEIGSDALFGLHKVSQLVDQKYETKYLERVQNFYEHVRDNDLTLSVAQTDVKGDRASGPRTRPTPTATCASWSDGTTASSSAARSSTPAARRTRTRLIVLPTRAMSEAEGDYAVAFAIPVNTPGVKLVASPYGGRAEGGVRRPAQCRATR